MSQRPSSKGQPPPPNQPRAQGRDGYTAGHRYGNAVREVNNVSEVTAPSYVTASAADDKLDRMLEAMKQLTHHQQQQDLRNEFTKQYLRQLDERSQVGSNASYMFSAGPSVSQAGGQGGYPVPPPGYPPLCPYGTAAFQPSSSHRWSRL